MRYGKGHKEETRRRLVEAAIRLFREKGLNGVGVATLMKELGLTHGGFYAHFKSRDDLVMTACQYGLEETGRRMLEVAENVPPDKRLETVINRYLSAEHRDDAGLGCVMAALGSELARTDVGFRRSLTQRLAGYAGKIARYFTKGDEREKFDKAVVLLGGMLGCVLISRVLEDKAKSDHVLEVARNFYIKAFQEAEGAEKGKGAGGSRAE